MISSTTRVAHDTKKLDWDGYFGGRKNSESVEVRWGQSGRCYKTSAIKKERERDRTSVLCSCSRCHYTLETS